MAEQGFKRKLTAILSADVEGYSRLMGDNEEATVRTLTAYREIFSSLIQQRNGRVIDSPGDNLLVEFASVVDAVQYAVDVQKEINSRNNKLPENRRMQFRIGINLGDVIQEEGRIYGDGVNIAARLEGLSDAGGICVSRTAYDQVKSKLELGYEYLGEHSVKNIAEPIRVYRVLMDPEAAGKVIGEKRREKWRITLAAVIALIVGLGGLAGWYLYIEHTKRIEPASIEKMAYPLPDKPSIAVLPFVNIGKDPDQGYISDGFTNTIITHLYKLPEIFVIDRHSSSIYKGKRIKIQQVAEELGVRHVLEGSVEKSGNRIRVNAQLIDALSGKLLWAELYDREYKNIFAVQDEIIRNIVIELAVKISWGETARSLSHSTDNVKALDYFYQSEKYFVEFQKVSNNQTRELLKKAINEDPNYVRAIAFMGMTHLIDIRFGWTKDSAESLRKAEELAHRALSIKENYWSYALLMRIYLRKRILDQAITAGERAAEIEPNNAMANYMLATAMIYAGKPENGLKSMEIAVRLCPHPPHYFLSIIGDANYLTGRYEAAVFEYKRFFNRQTKGGLARNVWPWLIASYMEMGQKKEAKAELKKLMTEHPDFSIEAHIKSVKRIPYQDYSFLDRQINLLNKAGLSEKSPLPLPEKPSIAVLPFENMSDDPQQEYFSDGMTDDLISDLSKISGLFVIARNSSFQYKGKAVDVKQVSRELGVRYVLEGSVRKAGNRVRINAQLIDAITAGHLWAETYDEEVDNIFALQDRITRRIAETLAVKLTISEMGLIPKRDTDSLDAYLTFLKGWQHYRRFTPDALSEAIPLLEKAVKLDPNYWRAYAALAKIYLGIYERITWRKITKLKKVDIYRLADKYLESAMNGPNPLAYAVASNMHLRHAKFEDAIAAAEKAVDLDSNDPDAQFALGLALVCAGRHKQSVAPFKRAMRLDPFFQDAFGSGLAIAYFFMLELEKAAALLEQAFNSNPENEKPLWPLIATYGHLGRMQKARTALGKLRNFNPHYAKLQYFKYGAMKFKEPADNSFIADGLRKAGMD